ncbi:hypothetical protein [Halopseudomonas salegens]|uniref:Uncharacterized protein n=1 Tax=Halopseudomonas salegens TaxID=1434072 RepID=A0A1H2HLE2_9GAMM|nr:hypothetical protein [Halopseudomonas salegens]SDU32655.1 hypothetical protein SAMN05216210_3132 [Halopseudomonas salegens]
MTQGVTRSTFVTVLAWIFIGLSAFTTLIAIVQNLMVYLLFPREEMTQALQNDPSIQELPVPVQLMMSHMEFLFLGVLLVSLITLLSAIGLLLRKNWARCIFIGILGFGILWNAGGFIMQQTMMGHMVLPEDIPADMAANFTTMTLIFRIVSGIVALVFCTLFAWLIWRLISPGIKAEFTTAG